MGCKSAIKGNQRITVPEVEQLLRELLTLENPYTCPHGRPTIIRISKEEMDKRFRRIVE
jgi:DNA mismatch repair protein MutL